jgi:hypothetical protein
VIDERWLAGHVLVDGLVATLVNGEPGTEADATSAGSDSDNPEAASGANGAADRTMASSGQEDVDPVELGVELLRKFEGGELSVAAAVDRVETITTNPAVTRAVLDEAERRGVLEREEGVFQARGEGFVRYESEVISREGGFTCRRCGAGLSTGYFLQLEAGEHGPFGSSCIRKVTGRERE